jgi:hypothetical protein
MEVVLPNKNKKNVIILSILAFVFLASGIFLLWRVNQPETVAPEDSEAGQSSWGSCWYCCEESEFMFNSQGLKYCPGGSLCDAKITCGDGVTINTKFGFLETPEGKREACIDCGRPAPGDTEPIFGECSLGSQCNTKVTCYWPEVAYCGSDNKCVCKGPGSSGPGPNSDNDCTDLTPQCSPKCPEGYEPCTGSSCGSNTKTVKCSHDCKSCNNRYWVKKTCRLIPPPSPSVCDGGNWDTNGKPSGVYPYCSNIDYSFVAKDSDGVDKSTIIVKVNGDVRVNASKNTLKTGDQEVRVKETLSTETNCLESGSYTITASWKDKKGAGGAGTNCALTTSFTVAEEIKNPDWDITKIPTESCIDDNTENSKAKLEYMITIKNTGEGSGEITSIVDTLDSKVLEEYIEAIDSNGEFSGGKISWILTETERQFAPGQSKTYTYSYIVPKNAFATYDNTVEAIPSTGNSLIANASIIADCIIQGPETPPDEPLPGTGIFDDGQGTLILGFVLLFLGFTWRILGRGIIVSIQGALGLLEVVNHKQRMDTKKKFEEKVIKGKK